MWGLRGVQGSIFQGHQNPRASEFKGVEGPLIDKGFQWIGVSKIQRVSGKIYTRKGFEYWRIQNLRGFKGKHIHFQWLGVSKKFQRVSGKIYTQIWPRSQYHRPCIVKPHLRSVLFMGKTGPMGERTPREGIRAWEFNYSRIRWFYTSDYWQLWGSCIVF